MPPGGADQQPAGEVWELVLTGAYRSQIENLVNWGLFKGRVTILDAPDMCIYVQCEEHFDASWLCYTYHALVVRTFRSE